MVGDPYDGSEAHGGEVDGDTRGGSTGSGRLDRRAFVSLAGTVAAAALSGCSNESDDDPTTAGRQRDVDGPVVSVMTGAQPSTLDMGPSMNTPAGRPHFEGFLQSLVLPTHAPTGRSLTSDHIWTVDGSALPVPCAVESREVTDDGDVRYRFDDRLTYWSGAPLDGQAYYLRDRVGWLETNGAFREESFGGELESDIVYRRSPLAGPTNPAAARANAHPGMPPLPPAYSEPWVERFEDATTEEAVQGTYLDYHQGKLSVETFAEEGYGTGRYEVRSADDVTSELIELPYGLRTNTEVVYAEPRSEYPGPTDRPTLRIVCGSRTSSPGIASKPSGSMYDPRDFVNGDEIDFGRGVIAESKGDFFRKQVPDDIEQLTTWPNPAGGGRQLTFNWANDHLRRLWVRRAIVAAAPFERMRSNQYGRGSMAPSSDAGTLGSIAERALGESFVDSLYTYPLATDTDLAARWLRRAGYERVDGLWTGPEGEGLSLTLSVFSSEVGDVQTLVAGLEAFGIAIEVEQLLAGGISYEGNVEAGGFDLLVSNAPAGGSVLPYYGDWFSVWGSGMSMPPIAVAGNPLGSCRDDPPLASVPASVTLPSEPGSLAVDGVDYADSGGTYEHDAGETVALCETVDRLHDAGTDVEGFREAARRCARWYNYAVPNFVFAQDRVGLWAELSEFAVSADEDRSLGMSRGEPTAPVHYHVQAGTLRRAGAAE
ncbi:hypothetical protein I7X12_18990 [Halosimplex litoreum]|uniref:ABC transporter substrate-binding protein n=1 Tax=Halosimplex litoreum TaxID=1198301 RepID=A0A7T3KV51_9EURY|nr:hypothetical protein [Halosimplex litoreum]QPV62784.1 hypothetical protein I7X12_18990 [Halosimplex litoreum]